MVMVRALKRCVWLLRMNIEKLNHRKLEGNFLFLYGVMQS